MRESDPLPPFDLYRELEVDPTASSETIGAAYRSLARRFHPDAGAPLDARMRRLNLAHEWLMDPVRRARYDAATLGSSPAPLRHQGLSRSRKLRRLPSSNPPRSLETSARTVTASRLLRYFATCLLGVIGAYVMAVVIAFLAASTSLPAIVGIVVGEETALQLLNLVGNVAYAGTLGYFAAEATLSLAPGGGRHVSRPLWVIGGLAAAGFTFGFPAFSVSYLGGLAEWIGSAPQIAAHCRDRRDPGPLRRCRGARCRPLPGRPMGDTGGARRASRRHESGNGENGDEMAWVDPVFASKAAFKRAIDDGETVTIYCARGAEAQIIPSTGEIVVQGPSPDAPPTWRAILALEEGVIIRMT